MIYLIRKIAQVVLLNTTTTDVYEQNNKELVVF